MKSVKLPLLGGSYLVWLSILAATSPGFAQHAPYVYIWSPTNGATYLAPANLTLYARAVGNTNPVQTVEFFAGNTSLGVVTNLPGVLVTNVEPLYPLAWSKVLAGNYALKAVATDVQGLRATSSVVNISVVTNVGNLPLAVRLQYPTNGQTYTALARIEMHAQVVDSNLVQTVQFFAGTTSLGTVSNPRGVLLTNWSTANTFSTVWSNVVPGSYTLTAVAMDAAGVMATSPPVNITVLWPPPPVVGMWYPTNGQTFYTPTSIGVHARVADMYAPVLTMQYFANGTSIGIVTNTQGVMVTNLNSNNPFFLNWSNVTAGIYTLTAVTTDSLGLMGTSAPVTITVVTRPPPNLPLTVGWWYPTNGQTFTALANIGVHAWVVDSNVVRTVQYFANAASIGIVTNTVGVLLTNTTAANPFFLLWSNVLAGSYELRALATDALGITATSSVVRIYVVTNPPPPTNRPPEVRITSPPNAAMFRAPVNLPIYAYARDPDGSVTSVQFFAGTNSLGLGNLLGYGTSHPPSSYYTNMFFMVWSNAPVGSYALTAKACDNSNACTVSFPINITILPPSPAPPINRSPTVSVVATDPVAIEGTNCWVWLSLTNATPAWTNWPGEHRVLITNCGPKNATFTVRRSGDTNLTLTVTYAIAGTATNGMDYVTLPGTATILAGQRQAMIPVVPIDDGRPDINRTVILRLTPSTNKPLDYLLGSPASAEAIIFDSVTLNPQTRALSDNTFHINASGPNGAWFHVEYSTNMLSWKPICTNQVVNGWIDFIDPEASATRARFYRAVPEHTPPQ